MAAVVLLSPPLRYTTDAELALWAQPAVEGQPPIPMTVMVPEYDDYLRPAEARERFAVVPQARVVGVGGCKHLWVGEKYVREALNVVASIAKGEPVELPEEWRPPEQEAP